MFFKIRAFLITLRRIDWCSLILNLLLSLGTGALASFLVPGMGAAYAKMYKPPLAPPGWVFPVVWTILYILMGIAAYLVSGQKEASPKAVESAVSYYVLQLLVNLLWPILFFRLELYFTAFFWLFLLWYLVWMTWKKFSGLNAYAGKLLVPYLVWLAYAGYLNLAIAIAMQ